MTPEQQKEGRELLKAWLDSEKRQQDYFGQFLTITENGVVTHQAVNQYGPKLEEIEKLDRDAEEKKKKYHNFVKSLQQ